MKGSGYTFPLLVRQDARLVSTEAKILETTSCGFVGAPVPKAFVCQGSKKFFVFFFFLRTRRQGLGLCYIKKKEFSHLKKLLVLHLFFPLWLALSSHFELIFDSIGSNLLWEGGRINRWVLLWWNGRRSRWWSNPSSHHVRFAQKRREMTERTFEASGQQLRGGKQEVSGSLKRTPSSSSSSSPWDDDVIWLGDDLIRSRSASRVPVCFVLPVSAQRRSSHAHLAAHARLRRSVCVCVCVTQRVVWRSTVKSSRKVVVVFRQSCYWFSSH